MSGEPVITISRQLGSGGARAGRLLAERLGLRYIDREIVSLAAQELDLDEQDLTRREERLASFWERLMDIYAAGTPDAGYTPSTPRALTDERLFSVEGQVIREFARHGGCVIVGRCGWHILRDEPRATHVLLVAPAEWRVRRVVEEYGAADQRAAQALVDASDRDRRHFVERLCGCRWLEASHYHLCLDASTLPLGDLVDVITEFVRRRGLGAGG